MVTREDPDGSRVAIVPESAEGHRIAVARERHLAALQGGADRPGADELAPLLDVLGMARGRHQQKRERYS
jgi:hypothetical protein